MTVTRIAVRQPAARCTSRHPSHKAQVQCEERGEHDTHFNSFFMRAWTDEDAAPEPEEN